MTRHLLSFAAAMLVASASPALHAQSVDDVTAYEGIVRTPAGAFTPLMTNSMLDRLQNGASLALRVGHLSAATFDNATTSFGVTGILPAGLSSMFSLTAGVVATDCSGCNAELMLGAGGDTRLYASPFGTTSASPLVTVSLDGQLGYGKSDPGGYVSGYVGLPVALVARGNGMQFVPYVTPGFGFAQFSDNGASNSGTAMILAGGLGIYNKLSNVSVDVGVQRVFITGGQTTIGLSLSIGGH